MKLVRRDNYALSQVDKLPFARYPTSPVPDIQRFTNKHLVPNTPFLLSARATAAWPAVNTWNDDGKPNLTALEVYGDQVVPVANTAARQFSEFERQELPLSEVISAWRGGEKCSYVKDWHLVAELQAAGCSGREVYAPPDCFQDDWLSPSFDATVQGNTSTADFRFVYAGPSGTFTPLHRDVYGSYSWSANVVGRKIWWLFPPGTEEDLTENGHQLAFDVRGKFEEKGVKILQEAGEVIFVPSGWHHQVVNVDFCISINHNFFASPTLGRVYAALRASEARCAESITDIKSDIIARVGDATENGVPLWEIEWAEEVDGLLARDAGWGWAGFWGCVLDNMINPPAAPHLSPSVQQRNAFVAAVLEEYKASREYVLLKDARGIVQQIETLLETSGTA